MSEKMHYRTVYRVYKQSLSFRHFLYSQAVAALPFPTWARDLARLEGALPFLSPTLATMLAQRSLRRLWAHHVTAFPFDDHGLEHVPSPDAGELARSWSAQERRDFCSWVARRAPPALAEAAQRMLRAKGLTETFSSVYEPAERALARLDALLPATEPLDTLNTWIRELREEELPFLEGGSETYVVHDQAYDRAAPRGAAWAAALAAAMRPQLFALGAAPLALPGLAPRGAFREVLEHSVESWLTDALERATQAVREDLDRCRRAEQLGAEALAERNRSSCAHHLWPLLVGLGPLTRAEAARALGVTKATASHGVTALVEAGLVSLRSDGALLTRSLPYQASTG